MTPGARVAAAIEILDQIIGGVPAERALTTWARGSRFAGSKDRAAVRDHVFDVLRAKRSLGDGDGRALMIALGQRESWDMAALFSGEGHAPSPLAAGEGGAVAVDGPAACDIPDWLWPEWQDSLGQHAQTVAHVLQRRAGIFLRVNQRQGTREAAISVLAEDGIVGVSHAVVRTAIEVIENPRKVKSSKAYVDGLVEVQDPSSQAAVTRVSVPQDRRVLDYCAGGGGKALAFADLHDCAVFAHDVAPERMKDIPARAVRAGVTIHQLDTALLNTSAPFDVVFCDAPCSGSGTWRRTPDAKWRLTAENLIRLGQMQDDVIAKGAALVAEDGVLAYATCSVLASENDAVVDRFMTTNPSWIQVARWQDLPSAQGDGFFLCLLRRGAAT